MWWLLTTSIPLLGPAAVFWTNLVLLRRWGKCPKLKCFTYASLTGICATFGVVPFLVLLDIVTKRGDVFGSGLAVIFGIGLVFLSWLAGWIWLLMPDKPPKEK
jgi:hypothetical protein